MTIRNSPATAALIDALAELPGYGPKSAQRAAFWLLAPEHRERLSALAGALEGASAIRRCRLCRTWCEAELCPTCSDERRDRTLLCVVESVQDQMALDASLSWPGLYFVLSGRLSPLDNAGPGEIGFPELLERIALGLERDGLREVVVATSYTPEGDATAYYLIDAVKRRWPELRITRLSRGLPSGLEIEYTDPATIAGAVEDRRRQ